MENAYHKALALADAELSPAELPALVDELARNPSMVRALQVYMTVGRGRLAKTYEAKRAEPVPQWLIDTVMHAPVEQSAGQSSKVVSYGSALLERMRRRYRMPGWSLAAGPAFAAVLAAVSAWLLVPNSSHGETLHDGTAARCAGAHGDQPGRFQTPADLLEQRSKLVPPVRDAVRRGAHASPLPAVQMTGIGGLSCRHRPDRSALSSLLAARASTSTVMSPPV